MARVTLDIVLQVLEQQGITYISGFENTNSKITCICSCGRNWSTTYHTIKSGSKCRYCRDYSVDARNSFSLDQIKQFCTERGYTYLDGYINTDHKFNFICSCGAKTSGYYHNIKRKHAQCDNCRIRGFTQQEVDIILASYGLELLGPYVDTRTPIIYLCRCGNIHQSVFHSLHTESVCPRCCEFKWRSEFLNYGHEIIEYKNAASIIYRCSCGNIRTLSAANWFNTNKECPNCRINVGIRLGRVNRPCLNSWKKAVALKDNFQCRKCESEVNLHAHHIEAYSIRPELVAVVDNGGLLCQDCHIDYHRLFSLEGGVTSWELFLK